MTYRVYYSRFIYDKGEFKMNFLYDQVLFLLSGHESQKVKYPIIVRVTDPTTSV